MVLRNKVSDRLLGQPGKIETDTAADFVELVGEIDRPIRHTYILAIDIRRRHCKFASRPTDGGNREPNRVVMRRVLAKGSIGART